MYNFTFGCNDQGLTGDIKVSEGDVSEKCYICAVDKVTETPVYLGQKVVGSLCKDCETFRLDSDIPLRDIFISKLIERIEKLEDIYGAMSKEKVSGS
jgi:hypothetical protein